MIVHELYGSNRLQEDSTRIDWNKNDGQKLVTLSPVEKTQFSYLAKMARSSPARIEVAILGRDNVSQIRQWRASTVCIPTDDNAAVAVRGQAHLGAERIAEKKN